MSFNAVVLKIKGGPNDRQKALDIVQSSTSPWSVASRIGKSRSEIADGHKRFTYSSGECVTSVSLNNEELLVMRVDSRKKTEITNALQRSGLNGGLVQGNAAEQAKQYENQLMQF